MPTPEDYENVIETLEVQCEELSRKNDSLQRALDKYEVQTSTIREVLLGLTGDIQWY